MEEMVEPDRTITIVSIIGLVIIWGSFFYHKYVQGGAGRSVDADLAGLGDAGEPDRGDEDPGDEAKPDQSQDREKSPGSSKKQGKKRR